MIDFYQSNDQHRQFIRYTVVFCFNNQHIKHRRNWLTNLITQLKLHFCFATILILNMRYL